MAIKDEDGNLVLNKKAGKPKSKPKTKTISLLGKDVWWIDKKTPFHLYNGVIVEEGKFMVKVRGECVATKEKKMYEVPLAMVRLSKT